jgi:16S rRNA (adenine1518-N6/adenine1519-N6)-dimethyltransferase
MLHARKRFGQHFLHDPGVRQKIIAAVDARPGERIVEIGPGPGALTGALIEAAGSIDAIEIDRDLAAELAGRFGGDLRLHVGDALEFDFAALAQRLGGPLRLVGNLPYNISTPLLFHLLRMIDHVADLHVMLQKEVVDRMAAAPGDEAYGRLTVMLAPRLRITRLFDVGPGAFHPPPRVWSAVARLEVLPAPAFVVPPAFAAVVAAAFSQRRKTLRNSLRALLTPEAFAQCGVDAGARPETIAPGEFAALAALAHPATL